MPRNRGERHRVATGIYRDASGYAVVVTAGGERQERRFPHTLTIEQLIAKRVRLREEIAAEVEQRGARTPQRGSLAADAPGYLAAVRSMPSFDSRERHIGLWVDALGLHQRDAITPAMVSTQLHLWRKRYAAQTCNHLRTALGHLYSLLDGKGARNPARDVPKFPVEQEIARNLPPLDVARILRQFRPGSKTRARLAVIATTGLSHAEVKRMQPQDVDLRRRVLVARARRKGAGSSPRTIPLTRHAVRALRLFARLDAWGPFSNSSMHSRFRDACANAGFLLRSKRHPRGVDWRPYDLRHTFAAEVARASGDERAVQELLGHTSRTTTRRYTLGSVDARVSKAIQALEARDRGPIRGPSKKRPKLRR
jgi:integrase